MRKAIIFGAGGAGQAIYKTVVDKYDIIGFIDNDTLKWGQSIFNLYIYSPQKIFDFDFDFIIIGSTIAHDEMVLQLKNMGIDSSKIISEYVKVSLNTRVMFLKRIAQTIYDNSIEGCVAEAGVFRGEFAKEINKYFPDRKCFLFDTFDGFPEEDIKYEKKKSLVVAEHMKNSSEQLVYDKMLNKEMVEIKKGYFPNTAKGIEEKFCFVNLDMDLYKPTYEGLVFFYPKLVSGGIILIHDYFSDVYPNVKQAVEDYQKNFGIHLLMLPIGDDVSIAIMKL